MEVAAPHRFDRFAELSTSFTLDPFQHMICSRLQQLPSQKGQRVAFHAPPQVGKTILVSQRYPAWVFGRDPAHRIRLACYNVTHAKRLSKVILQIMRSPEYSRVFPGMGSRIPSTCQAENWSTFARSQELDGQPSFAALGLGSGFVGLGADTMIVDDPYKNAEEAYSPVIREKIWVWWTDVVMPRINPDTNIVVMFHRWHEDDLAGRLLNDGGWEYMRFAAIADDDPRYPDPLGREPGEILTPRLPMSLLDKIKALQGITFEALFQGIPQAAGGGLFRRTDFDVVRASPTGMRYCRFWDTAAKIKEVNNFTASVLGGAPERPDGTLNGHLYVMNCWADRVPFPEQKEAILQFAATDPPGTIIAIEDTSNGIALLQDLYTDPRAGKYAIIPVQVAKDKGTRAAPAAARARAKMVHLVQGEWIQAFLSELEGFPLGANDDRVDAFSGMHAQIFGANPTLGSIQTDIIGADPETTAKLEAEAAMVDRLPPELQRMYHKMISMRGMY